MLHDPTDGLTDVVRSWARGPPAIAAIVPAHDKACRSVSCIPNEPLPPVRVQGTPLGFICRTVVGATATPYKDKHRMVHFAPPGPLGFGGAPLGNMFDVVDEGTADAALTAAWETGVRYFDTAPHYGSGLSEHRFGAVLRRHRRDEFVLSSKVGRLLRPDTSQPENPPFVDGLPFRVKMDYSYDATLRSIEDSLQRLGLAQIDIAFVHDVAADHLGDAWEEHFEVGRAGAFRALSELRDPGVIEG